MKSKISLGPYHIKGLIKSPKSVTDKIDDRLCDTCKKLSMDDLNLIIGVIKSGDSKSFVKILYIMHFSTLFSIKSVFLELVNNESEVLFFVDSINAMDNKVSRSFTSKISLLHNYLLVSDIFNDGNLINLKKAINSK